MKLRLFPALTAAIAFSLPSLAWSQQAYPTIELLATGTTVIGEEIRYPTSGPAKVTASIVTIAPGADSLVHRHPAPLVAYILEGECIITPTGGEAVKFGKGDLVTFPAGMTAQWEVKQPLHKHYQLDGSKLCQIWRRIKLALKL